MEHTFAIYNFCSVEYGFNLCLGRRIMEQKNSCFILPFYAYDANISAFLKRFGHGVNNTFFLLGMHFFISSLAKNSKKPIFNFDFDQLHAGIPVFL